MNYALIFAGGTGQRMNSKSIPKQFLLVHGKPILVHTIEKFQNTDDIDGIMIVTLNNSVDFVKQIVKQFNLNKVIGITNGGDTGQDSIYNGLFELNKISKDKNDIVLIHDGVRPLIDEKTIKANIQYVKKYGNCITTTKSVETVLIVENNNVNTAINRANCFLGRAPQSFYLKDIYECHTKAIALNMHSFIDSAMLMTYFGVKLNTYEGPTNNIKVTTQTDFLILRSLLDLEENKQLNFGE